MNDLRLLIIGSDNIWSIERFYIKYLKQLGVDIHLFATQNRFMAYYGRSIFNKLLFKAGLSSFHKDLNRELIDHVDKLAPNVIWVFKGMEVLPATLAYFKEKGIFLMNYNPDNPFIFSGRGSGNPNVTNSIGLFHLHLTYDQQVQKQIIDQFSIPAEILPFGFDLEENVFEESARLAEVIKPCFIGNPDKARAAFIVQVAQHLPIDVYGHGWDKFIDYKNVSIHPAVYGVDVWKTLRKYRVQLNLMRIHNPDSHNMRTFEIPGIGGIMLAPATPDHKLYFQEGIDAFMYTDVADCVLKMRYILALPAEDASIIRQNAAANSIAKGYTYKDRTLSVLNYIHKYLTHYA